MNKLTVNQLDKKDKEISEALITLGLGRTVARTLAYLKNGEEATSDEIEKGTGLRQPEVSIVMRVLKGREWINERDEKKTGKGRPNKIYALRVGFNDIIDQFEIEREKANIETQEKIERLKEFGK